jgi:hypothetical protein
MPTTREELDQFHQFAVDQIESMSSPLDLREIVARWIDERERTSVRTAIERGLAEMEAGLGRDAWEAAEELRRKYGLPQP